MGFRGRFAFRGSVATLDNESALKFFFKKMKEVVDSAPIFYIFINPDGDNSHSIGVVLHQSATAP
jgi:hypothetical protein